VCCLCYVAPLAQLVERQSHNLKVASSILAGSNSLSLVLSFSRSLFLSFSLSLFLSFSLSLFLSFSLSLVLSFSRSLVLSFSRSLSLSFSRSLVASCDLMPFAPASSYRKTDVISDPHSSPNLMLKYIL